MDPGQLGIQTPNHPLGNPVTQGVNVLFLAPHAKTVFSPQVLPNECPILPPNFRGRSFWSDVYRNEIKFILSKIKLLNCTELQGHQVRGVPCLFGFTPNPVCSPFPLPCCICACFSWMSVGHCLWRPFCVHPILKSSVWRVHAPLKLSPLWPPSFFDTCHPPCSSTGIFMCMFCVCAYMCVYVLCVYAFL